MVGIGVFDGGDRRDEAGGKANRRPGAGPHFGHAQHGGTDLLCFQLGENPLGRGEVADADGLRG